ncbi:Homeodomain-like protein, partial [Halteromyces radiatus]|uniref:Homeodomain-like protein n=1 Tax=Halteromyces radiatus TaxID=101107 RepID=UPI00221EEE1A
MVLTTAEKAQVVAYDNAGWTKTKIANHLGVSRMTVHKTIQRFEENGSHQRKKGSGRKSKLTTRDVRSLERIVKGNRRDTMDDIKKKMAINVSHRTIRRQLNELGIHSRVGRKKPFVN